MTAQIEYPQVTVVSTLGAADDSVLLTETDHVENWVPEADLWNNMKDAQGYKFECGMRTTMALFEASAAPEPQEG